MREEFDDILETFHKITNANKDSYRDDLQGQVQDLLSRLHVVKSTLQQTQQQGASGERLVLQHDAANLISEIEEFMLVSSTASRMSEEGATVPGGVTSDDQVPATSTIQTSKGDQEEIENKPQMTSDTTEENKTIMEDDSICSFADCAGSSIDDIVEPIVVCGGSEQLQVIDDSKIVNVTEEDLERPLCKDLLVVQPTDEHPTKVISIENVDEKPTLEVRNVQPDPRFATSSFETLYDTSVPGTEPASQPFTVLSVGDRFLGTLPDACSSFENVYENPTATAEVTHSKQQHVQPPASQDLKMLPDARWSAPAEAFQDFKEAQFSSQQDPAEKDKKLSPDCLQEG